MWTTQEYVIPGANTGLYATWAVAAYKLSAPPPPALPNVSIQVGQISTSLVLVGSSPSGEGFYNTSGTTTDPSCRRALSVAATNGVAVTNFSLIDPDRLMLRLNTMGTAAGTSSLLTITNPDGQTISTFINLIGVQPHIDTVGVFRNPLFLLRLHNTTGYADIVASFSNGSQPNPIVGDWGAGFDTISDYDRATGQFFLRYSNTTGVPDTSFVLGNPNDEPIGGRWTSGAATFGPGVFRPSNGLLLLKNALSTGYADYVMVLGIPGDQGLADDWNGDSIDSPGVYRPSNQLFLLSNQVCNCSVYADYTLQLGNPGDAPFVGDWIGQGHAGAGVFRPSSGLVLLKNQLTTGYADIVITYGIPNDVPVAGHWQLVYPPAPSSPPNVLVPPTSRPVSTPIGPSSLGG